MGASVARVIPALVTVDPTAACSGANGWRWIPGTSRGTTMRYAYCAHISRRPPCPTRPAAPAAISCRSRGRPGARPHPAGDGHADDRPPRARVQGAGPEGARRHQAVFKTASPVFIYPSSGTGAWEAALRQHAVARRQGADVRDRPFRHAVAATWPRKLGLQAEFIACRLAQRRRRRAPSRRGLREDKGAHDQGGVRRAQRDLDRRHHAHRRGARARSMPPGIRRC